MKNKILLFILFSHFCALSNAQLLPLKLDVVSFEDNDYPDVEPETYTYDFTEPVESSVLDIDSNYLPDMEHRYFISVFGPRYLADRMDFHQGSDIVDGDNPENPGEVDIKCICDGKVVRIGDEGADGKWVTVQCDETFAGASNWGNIFLSFRHLHDIAGPSPSTTWATDDLITKGDTIGTMGETVGENIVFHLSVLRKYCDADNDSYDRGALYNVHPMRVFNPAAYTHVLDTMNGAELYLLDYDTSSAIYRLAVPYNQANIRAITISLPDGSYQKTYDFEKVSEASTGEARIRDTIEFLDGMRIYPYPFNRGQSAYERYISKTYPAEYPGSTERGYSMTNEGIFATPAYVLDLEVNDLPNGYSLEDMQVSVIDIWGNGIKTTGNHAPHISLYFDPADPEAITTRYIADNDLFFKTSETIEMSATIFDIDGSISQVELFVNGTSAVVDSSAPFDFNVAASTLTANSWNEITAVATDNSSNTTQSEALRVYVTGNNLLTRRLTQNAGDAEEFKNNGEVTTTTSYDLDLCYDGGDTSNIKQYIGLWFDNIGVGKNNVIEKAYLQFAAKDAECGAIDINIYGEAANNPAVFSTSAYNISNRNASTASVTWSPGCWEAGATGLEQRTADISSIVQETVNRSGWASGNKMVFILENDNDTVRRQAYSYHGCNPLKRKLTRLIIEYSPSPSALVSNPTKGEVAQALGVGKSSLSGQVQLNVFPNPSVDNEVFVSISNPEQEEWSLSVINSAGQVLMQTSVVSEGNMPNALDVGSLKPGIYFVQAKSKEQVLEVKLVRQ